MEKEIAEFMVIGMGLVSIFNMVVGLIIRHVRDHKDFKPLVNLESKLATAHLFSALIAVITLIAIVIHLPLL